MPTPIDPGDEDFSAASSRLNDGLRSCRAVLSTYRSLLGGDGDEPMDQGGFNETAEAGEESYS